ncbi:hypothetical protein [Micromonospora sp. NPDC051006]|uniref:hypothetical protein n=1 Tax=Micromonospora sp. NPDC051006 TaxID=3364283 RepID=UPI0037BB7803
MRAWGRAVLASVVLLAGCTASGRSETPGSAPATTVAGSPAAGGCGSRIETGPLPDWATRGFSGDARVAHVLGAKGDIVAVLFGNPLRVDRTDGSNNKILWVSRPAAASTGPTSSPDLSITATLEGSDTRVIREVRGGPGPSIIDLPQAGCWHVELRWSGRADTMDLVYAER